MSGLVRSYQQNSLVRLLPAPFRTSRAAGALPQIEPSPAWASANANDWNGCDLQTGARAARQKNAAREIDPELNSLLYLIACRTEWQKRGDPSAAWEVIAATRNPDDGTRAHALSLLEKFDPSAQERSPGISTNQERRRYSTMEAGMRTPYGLEIIESCMGCKANREGFFCRFSTPVSRTVDEVSHHTVMPAGAILFLEGQSPRGAFVLCSGKVKLSTTSKEGKVLILKQAEAGEVLGLSAAVSGTNYEMTAETASACQLNFIGRTDLMTLLQNESEVGMHAALWLSREFQSAYRDIHDLVLARSSSGKLARLLLSCAPAAAKEFEELHLHSPMTHEEMAQRIGSSRETVTRLLSDLKKKRLIRIEGATLIIRDRNGLEALAV
jgi:CRP/FNR family transcriptional regulator, cyclic AMP receptor protein